MESSSDAQESKGFFKGFKDSISYLVPQTTPKQQMASGSEQFKLPSKYRESKKIPVARHRREIYN